MSQNLVWVIAPIGVVAGGTIIIVGFRLLFRGVALAASALRHKVRKVGS